MTTDVPRKEARSHRRDLEQNEARNEAEHQQRRHKRYQ